ncbi:hypothetical protein GJ744_001394 [Endocarpon pusillum]|uniref:Uncharacterized protein n=1 Tax=Endocarpon pusillum TaxID=364733 RepID=A0A8H7AQG4_9EURO|nr:hypothetical protein GJ744_001394 [Endocarpon pusillum]
MLRKCRIYCKDIPRSVLTNLALIIGWRKGDAASTMAQSAGGQAIALLSLCLRSLYSYEDTGSILYHISQKAVPKTLAISSIGQLARGADLLAAKLSNIGFGNILAKVVLKIQNIYTTLGKSCPRDFFDPMTEEAVVDLLYSLSRIFCEEDCVVRISGTQAMGYIVTIVSVLFSEDFVLVIEGLLVQQGSRQSISLEIGPSSQNLSATCVSVEKRLQGKPISEESIIVDPNTKLKWAGNCSFQWKGHLSDALQLGFSDFGITCSPNLHVACCDLLALIASSVVEGRTLPRNETALPEGGLSRMLGSTLLQHTYHTYKTLFRISSSNQPPDIKSAYENLTQAFKSTVDGHALCSCLECDLSRAWSQSLKQNK